jgi:hypothetical protein
MSLLNELKAIQKDTWNAQVEAYQQSERKLHQKIADDKANFMTVVSDYYTEIVTDLKDIAARGSSYYFGHWSVRKEYYDAVLGPAMELLKKRFQEDGFTTDRFWVYSSYYIPEADGQIPKRFMTGLHFDLKW